uniref:Uncharacterized protein n=1 Tax=Anguilla anguilla TaxID=7936 RepID=A0A0E9SLH1_ANGAN
MFNVNNINICSAHRLNSASSTVHLPSSFS